MHIADWWEEYGEEIIILLQRLWRVMVIVAGRIGGRHGMGLNDLFYLKLPDKEEEAFREFKRARLETNDDDTDAEDELVNKGELDEAEDPEGDDNEC
jgi:hypothetical protein